MGNECFLGKHASLFCWRFIVTNALNNSSPKPTSKVESNLETWRHVEYYYNYSTLDQRLSELCGFNWLDPRSLHWIKLPLHWIFFSNQSVYLSSKPKLEMLVWLNAVLFAFPRNIEYNQKPSHATTLESLVTLSFLPRDWKKFWFPWTFTLCTALKLTRKCLT